MALLNRSLFEDVQNLLLQLERTQWEYRPNLDFVQGLGVLTRDDLRRMPIPEGFPTSSTSGATGEQLVVAKTYEDLVWYMATNLREMRWRKWDSSKSLAVVIPKTDTFDLPHWDLPRELLPEQGPAFFHKMDYIDVLQAWLEEKNPHYIFTLPSVLKALDLSRLPRFIDARTTSENGGTAYSSEECGTLALSCPDNPQVWHVMENIAIEVDEDQSAIVSSMTNPWIRRYRIGDHLELGECGCGRSLQTITRIFGRTRNMIVFRDGRRKWPTMGSLDFYTLFGIRRGQMVQTSYDRIEFSIIADPLSPEKMTELIAYVRRHLGHDFEVLIKYVDSFPLGKFEEFRCQAPFFDPPVS